MGVLKKKIQELVKVGVPTFFKDNSLRFFNLYNKPDRDVVNPTNIASIYNGGVYFMYYKDESNWMKYSMVLCADIRDQRLVFGLNLNFLPLEIRLEIFDELVISLEDNNKQSTSLNPFNFVTFESIYKKLIRLGFEYALVEYDVSRIAQIFEIKYEELPYWIYSQHPKNIYDPIKLYSIWEAKMKNRPERHKELISKLVSDFYNVTDELIDNSTALKSHFQRLKRNYDKFGDKFS